MWKRVRCRGWAWRKLIVGGVAATALAMPMGSCFAQGTRANANTGQTQTPAQSAKPAAATPKFEVVSIRPSKSGARGMGLQISPGRFTATNVPVKMIIAWAYKKGSEFSLNRDQMEGGPSWINSERFDIAAKIPDSLVQQEQKKQLFEQSADQIRLMVQSMFVERFKLKAHYETKQLPIYALIVAKHGPKLTQSKLPPLGPLGSHRPRPGKFQGMRMGRGQLTAMGAPVGMLADALSHQPDLGGREVVDQTGLKGLYDFTLKWTPEMAGGGNFGRPGANGAVGNGGAGTPMAGTPSAPASSDSGPSIFTAIRQQLGLKLKPGKAPVDILVIDHIQQPSPN
jgi:uncharacterized protein (TIGR03435 family)